ncbi:MAG: four helix bundle protein, partial [Candidatus Kerfeldbacteria bacterium]|nr:four helix bundle protein [Candidatus Kerfeldbacteria bacterium]
KIHIQKSSRYTLGEKIDALFIETLELIFVAQYISKAQKLPAIQKASTKFDALKFFLMILWEIGDLGQKQYAALSEKLAAIGNMLGGWLRKTAADAARDTSGRAQATANTKK